MIVIDSIGWECIRHSRARFIITSHSAKRTNGNIIILCDGGGQWMMLQHTMRNRDSPATAAIAFIEMLNINNKSMSNIRCRNWESALLGRENQTAEPWLSSFQFQQKSEHKWVCHHYRTQQYTIWSDIHVETAAVQGRTQSVRCTKTHHQYRDANVQWLGGQGKSHSEGVKSVKCVSFMTEIQ